MSLLHAPTDCPASPPILMRAVLLHREEVAGSQVELRHLDLADLDSIRQFCRASVDFGHPLDVLICNAAVMACPERWQTKQVGLSLVACLPHC